MIEVSIITPCRNCKQYMKQCIESVRKQSFTNWEMLWIDDGSSDGSYECAKEISLEDNRIRVFRTNGGLGAASARNVGIQNSTGKYLCFIDSDDWWGMDKLEKQIQVMKNSNAVFSCSTYMVCDQGGNVIRRQDVHDPLSYKRLLYKSNVVGCLTVMIEKYVLNELRFLENMGMAEDYALWLQVMRIIEAKNMKTCVINEPLAYYRVHPGGKSSNKIKKTFIQWKIYREYLGETFWNSLKAIIGYIINGIYERRPKIIRKWE